MVNVVCAHCEAGIKGQSVRDEQGLVSQKITINLALKYYVFFPTIGLYTAFHQHFGSDITSVIARAWNHT